jgi:hypothetical protein
VSGEIDLVHVIEDDGSDLEFRFGGVHDRTPVFTS